MNIFKNRKLKELVSIFFAVIIFCIALNIFHIGCPIKYITGISCAGCGMTRALLSLIKLNISDAFKYHPLFWMVPLFVIIYFFKNKIPQNIYRIIIIIYIVSFLICYFIRLFNPNDSIVTFDLKKSIFYILLYN